MNTEVDLDTKRKELLRDYLPICAGNLANAKMCVENELVRLGLIKEPFEDPKPVKAEPKQELKPTCPAIVVDSSKDEIQTVKLTKENEKELDNMAVNDPVNHPEHYQGKVECIDCLESATEGLSGIEAVCTANAIKYLYRWKRKKRQGGPIEGPVVHQPFNQTYRGRSKCLNKK